MVTSSSSSRRSPITKKKLNKDAPLILNPTDLDILCGRGRGFFEHPGNRRMLGIINQFKTEYQTSCKMDKNIIANRVLDLIVHPCSASGSTPRFLKKAVHKRGAASRNAWCELDEAEIVKKVAHTLREQKTIVNKVSTSLEVIRETSKKRQATTRSTGSAPGSSTTSSRAPTPAVLEETLSYSTAPIITILPPVDKAFDTSRFGARPILTRSHSLASRRDSVQSIDIDRLLHDIEAAPQEQYLAGSSSSLRRTSYRRISNATMVSNTSTCNNTAAADDDQEPLNYNEEPMILHDDHHIHELDRFFEVSAAIEAPAGENHILDGAAAEELLQALNHHHPSEMAL